MRTAILIMAAGLMPAAAWADGHTLQNHRLLFLFGSTSTGYSTADADRVDNITWVNSAGTVVENYITQADPACNDPVEFFGEAYGNGANAVPYAVIRGVTSTWTGTSATRGRTSITSLSACGASLDTTTKSTYVLSNNRTLVNTLKITRSFKFVRAASMGDFRPYVVRVPLGNYPYTIYPDSTGAVQTVSAGSCGFDCIVTDWNGKWMADDSGTGQGVAIFRAANAAYPAELTIDWDEDSHSNVSAITLIQPTAGWSRKSVTETEYLCFYDATSWTASQRAAGVPPTGCEGVPH
jgi:hypothetical protein